MARKYPAYEQALKRVDYLRAHQGIWPGIVGPDADGWYRLTYDPGDQEADR